MEEIGEKVSVSASRTKKHTHRTSFFQGISLRCISPKQICPNHSFPYCAYYIDENCYNIRIHSIFPQYPANTSIKLFPFWLADIDCLSGSQFHIQFLYVLNKRKIHKKSNVAAEKPYRDSSFSISFMFL